jgi:hypothetical protein
VTGRIDHSVVQPALSGGLVLIVMLIAFTIMQHAFAGGALAQGLISDAEQKALALVGAGHSIWDWDTARDRIETGRDIEQALGFKRGSLDGRRATGSASSIRASATSSVPCSTPWSTTARAHQPRFPHARRGRAFPVVCAPRPPIVGSDGEVMRCTGTIATSRTRRLPRSGCCTTRCTTT